MQAVDANDDSEEAGQVHVKNPSQASLATSTSGMHSGHGIAGRTSTDGSAPADYMPPMQTLPVLGAGDSVATPAIAASLLALQLCCLGSFCHESVYCATCRFGSVCCAAAEELNKESKALNHVDGDRGSCGFLIPRGWPICGG